MNGRNNRDDGDFDADNGRDFTPSEEDILDELAGLVDQDPDAFSGLTEDDVAEMPISNDDDVDDDNRRRSGHDRDDDLPEPEPLSLYPDWEYTTILIDPVYSAGLLTDQEQADLAASMGRAGAISQARQLLAPVQQSLTDAGFYAYSTVDDQNRWTIAADDEAGRIDAWVGYGGVVLSLWSSSPGLFADVENPWRRRRMERGVQRALVRVSRGMLAPHQRATWDDADQGIAVSARFLIPPSRGDEVGAIVRARLPELLELLENVEQQVTD